MWIFYKIERQIRLLCPLKFHIFQTDVYFLTGLVLIFLFCYIYLETIFVSFIPSSEIGKMKSDPFFSRRSVPIRFYFQGPRTNPIRIDFRGSSSRTSWADTIRFLFQESWIGSACLDPIPDWKCLFFVGCWNIICGHSDW